MRIRSLLPLTLLLSSTSLFACSQAAEEETAGADDAITSNAAKILDFKFKGEVIASNDADSRGAVVSQLMYAQGILTTARNGNGHVGNVTLTMSDAPIAGTQNKTITYEASLPIAWPKNLEAPTSYNLVLPKDATQLDAFNRKYDGRCGNNEYGQDTFWHDWNPKATNCTIDDADVIRSTTTSVKPHPKETKNKYPEYDLIWKDGRLDIVAIFGIITSNTPGDQGYIEARTFLEHTKGTLTGAAVTDNQPSASILKDQTLTGKVTVDGQPRDVKIDILVVQEMKSVAQDFDTRYNPLSEKADMILYNGHAGLGKNVNTLAGKGTVVAGKYQMMLLNGCQTFAYMNTTLSDRRRTENGAANDPDGYTYLDVIGNALPGLANNLASMSNTLFDAVIGSDTPKTYNDLLANMPTSHIVVVFGEDNNKFQPR